MENYIQIRVIGEGSFGKAILVKKKTDGKQYVIKEICISKMSVKEQAEAHKEVLVLSQLEHPNIVRYSESFQGNGNLYIVMDYCESGDLYQMIVNQKGMKIEETKVLDIFVQCCLAVKHIHDRKILHRDIKTQNIFLTMNGIVKLGDFGIARILKSTMELAHTCIGTPYYLSPEIVEGRPYNNKSDIWSLGCVLYELITLKHAFEAENMKMLVMKIIRGSYPALPSDYSMELKSLVAHCLKRNPSERPSVNTLLQKTIIQNRISKYLTKFYKEEFNILQVDKTGLHSFEKEVNVKPTIQPLSVYGAKALRKVYPDKKHLEKRNIKNASPKLKGLNVRERKRIEIIHQENLYQQYMEKIRNQRWQNIQAGQILKAREEGWKNVLGINKRDEEKYGVFNNGFIQKEEKRRKKHYDIDQRVLVDDFLKRKQDASVYKYRNNQDNLIMKDETPLLKFHNEQMYKQEAYVPLFAGNKQEVVYLQQLEEIRKQNFFERKQILNAPAKEISSDLNPYQAAGFRKKKIEALKLQVFDETPWLQENCKNEQKKLSKQLVESQTSKNSGLHVERLKDSEVQSTDFSNTHLDIVRNFEVIPKFNRTCSEGDIKFMKKVEKINRKHWNSPTSLHLNALECSKSFEQESSHPHINPIHFVKRNCWIAEGKTDLLSALHKREFSKTVNTSVMENTSLVFNDEQLNSQNNEQQFKINTTEKNDLFPTMEYVQECAKDDIKNENDEGKAKGSYKSDILIAEKIKENPIATFFKSSDQKQLYTDKIFEKDSDSFSRLTFNLAAGTYDTQTKLLRTCSLPDLIRRNSLSEDNLILENKSTSYLKCDKNISTLDNSQQSEHVTEEDIDEYEFEHLLQSMRSVLNTMKEPKLKKDMALELFETEWLSDGEEKSAFLKESVYSNIEELRIELENELGFELFVKVYKLIQLMQDDNKIFELDEQLSKLLGDKVRLYNKILYLVIADAIYCEGNDGSPPESL